MDFLSQENFDTASLKLVAVQPGAYRLLFLGQLDWLAFFGSELL
jgi:hypothetical protein